MTWSPRLLSSIIVALAALPPLISPRLAHPMPSPKIITDRAGLTLGADRAHQVVVTSLRTGGPADRSGIEVGDIVRQIGTRSASGVALSRRLIDDPARCDVRMEIERSGLRHIARLQQCAKEAG